MGVDTKHRNVGFLALSGRCTVTSLRSAPSQKRSSRVRHFSAFRAATRQAHVCNGQQGCDRGNDTEKNIKTGRADPLHPAGAIPMGAGITEKGRDLALILGDHLIRHDRIVVPHSKKDEALTAL